MANLNKVIEFPKDRSRRQRRFLFVQQQKNVFALSLLSVFVISTMLNQLVLQPKSDQSRQILNDDQMSQGVVLKNQGEFLSEFSRAFTKEFSTIDLLEKSNNSSVYQLISSAGNVVGSATVETDDKGLVQKLSKLKTYLTHRRRITSIH